MLHALYKGVRASGGLDHLATAPYTRACYSPQTLAMVWHCALDSTTSCVKSTGPERGLGPPCTALAAGVKDRPTGFGCITQSSGSPLDRVLEDTSWSQSSESWSKEFGDLLPVKDNDNAENSELPPVLLKLAWVLPPHDSDAFRS